MTTKPAPTVNPFTTVDPALPVDLPQTDQFPQAAHRWSIEEIDALTLALAARRPLLVRGEAGSGKSQIARAAAKVLGDAQPICQVIHPRFEALDLLYRHDAIRRLADAQIKNRLDLTNKRYVQHGPLWQAMERLQADEPPPVLLIDEIDKADADVPNALLDVLGNRSFQVAPLNNQVVRAAGGRMPLVIITTNEERELPAAFVRRCIVLNLNPPTDDAKFLQWLDERGRVHTHLRIADGVRESAARQVLADRKAAFEAGYPKVGLAEYIDLLTAVDELTARLPKRSFAKQQAEWLDRLSRYALVKNADQFQGRAPVSRTDGRAA